MAQIILSDSLWILLLVKIIHLIKFRISFLDHAKLSFPFVMQKDQQC